MRQSMRSPIRTRFLTVTKDRPRCCSRALERTGGPAEFLVERFAHSWKQNSDDATSGEPSTGRSSHERTGFCFQLCAKRSTRNSAAQPCVQRSSSSSAVLSLVTVKKRVPKWRAH